jgi:putative ABC transport system permease protein
MFKNNLIVAFRNLSKRKSNSFINIIGLAIGVGGCLLISLYVHNELSYDRSFAGYENIYKLIMERHMPEQTEVVPMVPHSFVTIVPRDIAGVEKGTSLAGPFNDMLVTYNDRRVLENNVYAADSNFFDILSFRILKGNPHTMLAKPWSIVLTESTAKKYFNDTDPIGKSINMSRDDYVVTGVCEDPGNDTHFKFNLLISQNSIERFGINNFTRSDVHAYFRLKQGADAVSIGQKFEKLVDTYAAAEIESLNKISWETYKKAGNGYRYFLHPLASVHLDPLNLGGMKAGGKGIYINVLIGVAVLLFVIACINFINLTLARSNERAKEVGIRRVMGSSKKQLVWQFLTESFLLSLAGVTLAVMLALVLIPYFNMLTGSHINWHFDISTIALLSAVVVAVTLLAGAYPSIVLSLTSQLNVFRPSSRDNWFMNGLVTFQFWISITLTICVMVMHRQMDFLSQKDLGFDKEQLVVIEGDFHTKPDLTRSMVAEMMRMPEIISASGGLSMPSFGGIWEKQYKSDVAPDILTAETMYLGDGFLETMNAKMLSGRNFSTTTNDTASVILNESAVRALGLKDPIGHTITYIEQTYGTGEQVPYTVIGVVQDFHYASLHENILPLVIQSNEIIFSRMRYIIARVKAGENAATVAEIETKWKELAPEIPFKLRYADLVIDNYYQKEKQSEDVFKIFAGLSIFVACIGLFGLSSYTLSQRTREIGIRKVVGASVKDLLMLLSKDVVQVILVALLLATPVAWYLMESWWLKNFVFKVTMELYIILTAGGLALLLALATVSYQVLKVTLRNPVQSIGHTE